jgi:hypothetical protein
MSSFPASKYARYKRATAFFLDWLLRARGRGRHSSERVELAALGAVVNDVAAEPSSLTPKLLQELPKALAACQCAITLREHVATFFSESDAGQGGHRHFLELLRDWHNTLKAVETETAAPETQSQRFENYYAVLEVGEDFFPDTESSVVGAKGASKKTQTDRKRLFDEAFAEDLRLEVVYFFLELEELVEGVFNIYVQVKKQQRTMVEATVVAKLAMEAASTLTAKLQLRYPALETAEDVFAIVTSKMPMSFRMRVADTVAKSWESFQRNGKFEFVQGMLVVDFMSVSSTLASFSSAIPTDPRQTMILRERFKLKTCRISYTTPAEYCKALLLVSQSYMQKKCSVPGEKLARSARSHTVSLQISLLAWFNGSASNMERASSNTLADSASMNSRCVPLN